MGTSRYALAQYMRSCSFRWYPAEGWWNEGQRRSMDLREKRKFTFFTLKLRSKKQLNSISGYQPQLHYCIYKFCIHNKSVGIHSYAVHTVCPVNCYNMTWYLLST